MKKLLSLLACIAFLLAGFTLYRTFLTAAPSETVIVLSDEGITVNGGPENRRVFTSHDILYYEDRDTYPSGNPYGEGQPGDRHTAQEAAAHTVVNITAPGTYRVTGKLSAGQIRIDLGDGAKKDPGALVNLILSHADVTCTVAPAIVFLNVYECDAAATKKTASPTVDTTGAGANLILEGSSTLQGSHVAKIYKDNGKDKTLWKQDGAVYSDMSLTIGGSGSLALTADAEGIDSQKHLTINDGSILIRAAEDGINASDDQISAVTVNGGTLRILSGLGGVQGDGIDSNGYLTIHGGTCIIWSALEDSPLDGEFPPMIHGGTVVAFGDDENPLHPDSGQTSLYLVGQFSSDPGSSIGVVQEDGTAVLAYDPAADPAVAPYARAYRTAIFSCPDLTPGSTCTVQLNPALSGNAAWGLYQNAPVTSPGTLLQTPSGQTGLDLQQNVSVFQVSLAANP